jgi:hypothetical protein
MSTNTKYRPVYKMDYAMELIKQGHEVVQTIPNPKNNRYITWIFKVDDTFDKDLMKLRRKE